MSFNRETASGVSTHLEELECLQAIYTDSPHDTLSVEARPDSSLISLSIKFTSFPVSLTFNLPPDYPKECPTDLRVDSLGIGMSRLQLFEMQLRLGLVIAAKRGEPVLFDLTDEVCAFAAGLRGDIYDTMGDEEGDMGEGEGEDEEYGEEPLDNRREFLDFTTPSRSQIVCLSRVESGPCDGHEIHGNQEYHEHHGRTWALHQAVACRGGHEAGSARALQNTTGCSTCQTHSAYS